MQQLDIEFNVLMWDERVCNTDSSIGTDRQMTEVFFVSDELAQSLINHVISPLEQKYYSQLLNCHDEFNIYLSVEHSYDDMWTLLLTIKVDTDETDLNVWQKRIQYELLNNWGAEAHLFANYFHYNLVLNRIRKFEERANNLIQVGSFLIYTRWPTRFMNENHCAPDDSFTRRRIQNVSFEDRRRIEDFIPVRYLL